MPLFVTGDMLQPILVACSRRARMSSLGLAQRVVAMICGLPEPSSMVRANSHLPLANSGSDSAKAPAPNTAMIPPAASASEVFRICSLPRCNYHRRMASRKKKYSPAGSRGAHRVEDICRNVVSQRLLAADAQLALKDKKGVEKAYGAFL